MTILEFLESLELGSLHLPLVKESCPAFNGLTLEDEVPAYASGAIMWTSWFYGSDHPYDEPDQSKAACEILGEVIFASICNEARRPG